MDADEREILEELRDCNGEVADRNYDDAQRLILARLAGKKLVVLCWVITDSGRKALGPGD